MKIAILIPCFNEAAAIKQVILDFRLALPQAEIYVYDNNSTDGTPDLARHEGVQVRHEPHQGKGHVVCRMFSDVEADVYVLVDGDGTYDAKDAAHFVSILLDQQLDLVNGKRVESDSDNFRRGHRVGNWVLTRMVSILFGQGLSDMLSGYKIFSRRFVKSFPRLSVGFEIETQLVIHALQMSMPSVEIPTKYFNRMRGSVSKLNTYSDGLRILQTILRLLITEKPILFFGGIGMVILILCLLLGIPIVSNYLESGLVPRLPTWVTIVSLVIVSIMSTLTGLLMQAITINRKETRRLIYLSIPHSIWNRRN
jgi:glycosyltransferase involved in cell wall biosynthesis